MVQKVRGGGCVCACCASVQIYDSFFSIRRRKDEEKEKRNDNSNG